MSFPDPARAAHAAMWMSVFLLWCSPSAGQDRYAAQRRAMVRDAVAGEGIRNKAVLAALGKVPRHEFVLAKDKRRAYTDMAMAIGHQQTISPPFIVAYMTEALDPQPTDRVLEIGTGSGYQAAVLAEIVEHVYSIEIVEPLGKEAAKRLKKLGYSNVSTRVGDGYKGWAKHAPFDKIIVTCSPEDVPGPLVKQLREGGRMIVPLGERYQQTFHLLTKKDGKLVREKLIPTLFVPMTGESESRRLVRPNPNEPQIVNGDFEADTNKDGRPDNWHYQRQSKLITEKPQSGSYCIRMESKEPGRLAQMLQGTAINGKTIGSITLNAWIRTKQVRSGPRRFDRAEIQVHFFDKIRREIGYGRIGSFVGTNNWQRYRKTIPVPPAAREMIVRVGLNGATGTLDVDDLQMTFQKK